MSRNRREDHGLFFEYDPQTGQFRAGAFGWIGIAGMIAIAIIVVTARYFGL
jgi:LPXTG-motif cell wall-anchored protein